MTLHSYSTAVTWEGSTALGYNQYSRTHTATAAAGPVTITLNADASLRGDAAHLNREQLLVPAASSRQLL